MAVDYLYKRGRLTVGEYAIVDEVFFSNVLMGSGSVSSSFFGSSSFFASSGDALGESEFQA